MIIREEKKSDYELVENLTREAFWNVYQPGCSEHLILHNFRHSPAFIKDLDMVLEEDSRIAAHIMYCKASIKLDRGGSKPIAMFGPISVHPDYQRKGLGSSIINFSLNKAKEMRIGAVAITGNPQYYQRFGFKSASEFHVYYPGMKRKEEAPFFMIIELEYGYLDKVRGVLEEPKEYQVTPDEVQRFDKKFPPKEKKVLPTQLS